MLTCFVCLLLDALPFFSRSMVLLLSWNRILLSTLYPCASIKYHVQQIASMKLSAPTTSVSVELRVLSFCLVKLMTGNPHPRDNPPPECPLIFGWTVNDASTHHFKMPLPSVLKISGSFLVPLMYFIRWTSLAQPSLSGSCTLIVRNVMAVHVSSLAHFVAYSVFTTRL